MDKYEEAIQTQRAIYGLQNIEHSKLCRKLEDYVKTEFVNTQHYVPYGLTGATDATALKTKFLEWIKSTAWDIETQSAFDELLQARLNSLNKKYLGFLEAEKQSARYKTQPRTK